MGVNLVKLDIKTARIVVTNYPGDRMFPRKSTVRLLTSFLVMIVLSGGRTYAQESNRTSLMSDRIPADRMKQYADQAVQWEQEYLRIDTTNPPGNEMRTAVFYKKILDAEGIENRIFEYLPGRADL